MALEFHPWRALSSTQADLLYCSGEKMQEEIRALSQPQTKTSVVQTGVSVMNMIPVDSTTLRSVGYDAERLLLQIEFQNHSLYQYFNVPATAYEELLHASSKGACFNRTIRSRFDFALFRAASLS